MRARASAAVSTKSAVCRFPITSRYEAARDADQSHDRQDQEHQRYPLLKPPSSELRQEQVKVVQRIRAEREQVVRRTHSERRWQVHIVCGARGCSVHLRARGVRLSRRTGRSRALVEAVLGEVAECVPLGEVVLLEVFVPGAPGSMSGGGRRLGGAWGGCRCRRGYRCSLHRCDRRCRHRHRCGCGWGHGRRSLWYRRGSRWLDGPPSYGPGRGEYVGSPAD